jgi:hypothetical protein
MNTLENNKLIAEFMGIIDIVETNGIVFKDNNTLEFHQIKYDTDWNWLMEVVERIESIGYDVNIFQNGVHITNYSNGLEQNIVNNVSQISYTNKIELVYDACIEFIKWYNENK